MAPLDKVLREEHQQLQNDFTQLKQQYEHLLRKYDRLSELFQEQQLQGWLLDSEIDDHK